MIIFNYLAFLEESTTTTDIETTTMSTSTLQTSLITTLQQIGA
jgi:hypothetical protein